FNSISLSRAALPGPNGSNAGMNEVQDRTQQGIPRSPAPRKLTSSKFFSNLALDEHKRAMAGNLATMRKSAKNKGRIGLEAVLPKRWRVQSRPLAPFLTASAAWFRSGSSN